MVILLAWMLGTTGQDVLAQTQKIGYVVSPKIFQELPEALEAQRKLADIEKPLQDSLNAMAQNIQNRIEEYQKKETMMNETAKRAAQQEIQELQRKASEFAELKQRELVDERERIFGPVREKIVKAIETVAREEKYNFVFDKNDTQTLIYGDTTHDLTFKVLDRLKRGR
jgi:outer membrane protein